LVRRQEAGEDVRGQVAGGRIDGGERPRGEAGREVDPGRHVEVDAQGAGEVEARAVGAGVGRHGVGCAADVEIADLERGPVEARVEVVGDDDLLNGDVGG